MFHPSGKFLVVPMVKNTLQITLKCFVNNFYYMKLIYGLFIKSLKKIKFVKIRNTLMCIIVLDKAHSFIVGIIKI